MTWAEDTGNEVVARLLSVAATCKQQNRSVLDYLAAVCTADQRGQPNPLVIAAHATRPRGVSS